MSVFVESVILYHPTGTLLYKNGRTEDFFAEIIAIDDVRGASYNGVRRQTGLCLSTNFNVKILYGLGMMIMNVNRLLDKCNAFVYRQYVNLCSSTHCLFIRSCSTRLRQIYSCRSVLSGRVGTKQEKFTNTMGG
jgi:hypothetical protein